MGGGQDFPSKTAAAAAAVSVENRPYRVLITGQGVCFVYFLSGGEFDDREIWCESSQ